MYHAPIWRSELIVPGFATKEWKLRETRRRHIDELARLSTGSSSTERAWSGWSETPSFGSVYEIAPEIRGMSSSTMEVTGPVLVSCRRDCGAHRIRLWVEDLATIGSARVHALDEATGARMYRDIPDAALSRLLAAFKRSPTCDPDDVDDFLRAMLAACKIRMFPGGLDVVLPSEEDLHPAIKPAPLNLRVMQHISNMAAAGMRRPVSLHQPSSPSSPSKPRHRGKSTTQSPLGSAPSIAVSPFGVAPVTPLQQEPQAHAPCRPPRPSKPSGRPQPGTPRPPLRRASRPQSAPHTGRTEEPKSSEAMEATRMAQSCGVPQTPSIVAGFRGRRARPTSAKALKHRRVVDDSVDSIIYEDDEEEQEEGQEGRWPSYSSGEACETRSDVVPEASNAVQCQNLQRGPGPSVPPQPSSTSLPTPGKPTVRPSSCDPSSPVSSCSSVPSVQACAPPCLGTPCAAHTSCRSPIKRESAEEPEHLQPSMGA